MRINFTLFIIFSFFIFSCKLPVYVLTDQDIQEHYKDKKSKPQLKYISYKNYHIFHAITGNKEKPLLIFVHGAPGNWYSSLALLDDTALQKNFRMISVDRVGFGKSNYGLALPSIDKHVRYLEKIVKEYNHTGQPIYMVGSSYGAPIVASFATQNPLLVKELYLVSPVIDPATEKMFWFSYMAKLSLINFWLPRSLTVTSDEKSAHKREMRKLKPHLKNIRSKTYVLMGAKDWLAHPSNFTYLQKMLVNARNPEFIMLENEGHTILSDRPGIVKNLLLNRKPY